MASLALRTPTSAVATEEGLSVDDDLDRIWAEVIARANKITTWNLNERTFVTVEEVLAKIKAPKDGKPGIQDKAKAVFRQTMVCVQRFGSIAAQGASVVFGPSEQCFNAISFVIKAIQSYDEVFTNITALMERISVFLNKLNIYLDDTHAETKLDRRLRLTVYRVLEHFLTILGTAHKLTHGWKAKLKLAAKIGAFGEDDGIKDAMAQLETLVSDVTGAEITVIVKDLSEAARNIRGVDRKLDLIVDSQERTRSALEHLHSAEERRQADEEERKRLQAIQRVLGADKTVDTWTQRQEELVRTRLDGTGQWLLERLMFQRWADIERAGFEALCISGDSGYGKSYLSSIVVDHLQRRYSSTEGVCIAYYYFQRESADKDLVGTALRAIIWQLANTLTAAGREYRRFLANLSETMNESARPHELWRRLIKDIAKDMDATFFIILDGFDDDSDVAIKPMVQIFQDLLDADQPMKLVVQFLVTGRRKAINALHDAAGPAFAHIQLTKGEYSRASMNIQDRYSTNFLDIELFTRTRLAEMSIFKNTTDEEILQLRDRAEHELAVGSEGDYLSLIYKLDVISKSRSIKDLEAALELADESRSELIEREIDQLNQSLSKEEILELNDLLMWVAVIPGGIPVAAYEGVRRLRNDAKPLILLQTQVEERYSALLEVASYDCINFRTEDVRAYLERLEVQRSVLAESGGSKSSETFSQGEVEMVQRIVRTHFINIFGKDDIYEKFKFDKFFASKLGAEAVHIHLETHGSHLKVAQVCLTAICDHVDRLDFQALREMAYDNFIQVLMAVKPAELSAATKQDIARRLVAIFTRPQIIEDWWTSDVMHQVYRRSWRWFQSLEYVEAVREWLQDVDVQKVVKKLPSEQEWILSVVSGDSPPMAILSQVAMHAARLLFNDQSGTIGVVSLLKSYLTGMEREAIDWYAQVTIADLERVERWAKEQLDNADQTDQWDQRMAAAYDIYGFTEQSTARYRNAIDRSPEDWRAKLKLVTVLDRGHERKEAQALLELLIESSATLRDADELPDEEYRWDILNRHADISRDLGEHSKAESSYRSLLKELDGETEIGHSGYDLIDDLIGSLSAQGRYQAVMDLLEEIGEREDAEAETWLNAYLNNIAGTDISFNRLTTAALHTGAIQKLIDMLDRAIPFAPRRRGPIFGLEWSVHSRKAELLWTFGTEEGHQTALSIWRKAMKEDTIAESSDQPRYKWEHVPAQYIAVLFANLKSSLSIELSPTDNQLIIDQMASFMAAGHDFVTRVSSRNALARWYALSGDMTRARALLQDEAKSAFNDIESTDQWEVGHGFKNLGQLLAIVGDQVNAVAAYRLCEPTVRTANDDSDSEADGTDSTKKEMSLEDRLRGGLCLSCSGGCTEYWRYAENLWICQDCFEVQLDETCYRKLCDGALYVGLCSGKHSFLHLPPYGEELRNARTEGQVWVGDSLVDKREWLEGIKREWQLDATSLESHERIVSSVTKIQKAWATFSKIRRRD